MPHMERAVTTSIAGKDEIETVAKALARVAVASPAGNAAVQRLMSVVSCMERCAQLDATGSFAEMESDAPPPRTTKEALKRSIFGA